MKTIKLEYNIHEISDCETLITLKAQCDNEVFEMFWKYTGEIVPKKESMNGNFAVAAILPYAMHKNYNVHLEGCVSQEFIASLQECQDLWTLWRPELYHKVTITCDGFDAPQISLGNKAVMAFSGGVDACYSLHAHQRKLLGERNRNIELGLLIIGFDIDRDNLDWIKIAEEANRKILASYGAKQTVVETNWKDYCVDWEMSFGFGVTTTLHHFNKSHQFGVWSADEDYLFEVRPWGNHSSQNPLLSDRSFPIVATGAGLDRSSKVKVISENPEVLSNIRVCWAFPVGLLNCGRCEKCVRTYLNFKIAGVDVVDVISPVLKPSDISRIKIKHYPAKMFYIEILKNSGGLNLNYRRAVRHVIVMSKFYIAVKKFLDHRPKLKKFIMSKIDPSIHY